jgi:hypothetical protein
MGCVSQHARSFQCFDALRSRRHAARGFQRFVRVDAEIRRRCGVGFTFIGPTYVGAWRSPESQSTAVDFMGSVCTWAPLMLPHLGHLKVRCSTE